MREHHYAVLVTRLDSLLRPTTPATYLFYVASWNQQIPPLTREALRLTEERTVNIAN